MAEETEDNTEQAEDNSQAKSSTKKKKGSPFLRRMTWIFILIIVFALLRQSTVILLVAMLPTLVLKFVDESDGGVWFKTVLCFNLAGIYPYILELAMVHGNSGSAVQKYMADSLMWFSAYGGAGIGYLSMWFFPTLFEFLMRSLNGNRIKMYKKKLRRLHYEWGVGEPELLEFLDD